jgi:hypothetical protein
MNRRASAGVLVACVLVVLAVAWYAGAEQPPSATGPAAGTVRLGPEPGADVTAYLAGLPGTLPADGVSAPALVQLSAEVTTAEAADLVAGTTPVTAVFRVPLPRVQTALRFVDVEPAVPAATALDTARARAEQSAATDAARLSGRAAAVAAAERTALAVPGCRCTVALLVDGDRAGLEAVVARAGVRAVEGAPAGTVRPALAPLLPEQTVRADPPPDDGLVPATP